MDVPAQEEGCEEGEVRLPSKPNCPGDTLGFVSLTGTNPSEKQWLMTDEQSLRDIEALLNLYPGVTCSRAFRREDDEAVYIKFQCDSVQSLRELNYHATFTNGGIEVVPLMTTHEPLYFSITIPDDISDSPPSQSQRFGVFLVWALKSSGILPVVDSNKLLQDWNASSEPWTLDD